MLRYFDHVLPLRDGVADLPLGMLLAEQHYLLADWHDAATELNWRRFFDIDTLIAVRVEDPDVFEATHRVLLRLAAEGLIDGLRVDHPDGLADPRGYLRRLAERDRRQLGRGGEDPGPRRGAARDWPCAGTTGYDALALVGGLFVDPAGARPADRGLRPVHRREAATSPRWPGTPSAASPTPRSAAELDRLTRLFARADYPALAGLGEADLHDVLAELLAAFGVYRAYVRPGRAAARGLGGRRVRRRGRGPRAPGAPAAPGAGRGVRARCWAWAAWRATRRGRPPATSWSSGSGRPRGPVLAKGVEDTAFYRWPRLASAERGRRRPGHLRRQPGRVPRRRRAPRRPAGRPRMTTLSTHDTKRQEDVRARLAVLAEWPEDWAHKVAEWHGLVSWLTDGAAAQATERAPDPDLEYLMWQTLVGAWLLGGERLREYLGKAMHEAKTRTSWTVPDPGYEAAVLGLADAVLADPELVAGHRRRSWPASRRTPG